MTDLREKLESALISTLSPTVTAVASLRTEDATLPRVVVEANNFTRRIPGTSIYDIDATVHVISSMDGGLSTHKSQVVSVLTELGIDAGRNEVYAAEQLATTASVSYKAVLLEGIERELQDREIRDQIRLKVVAVANS
jgi:hypothetical protein